MWVEVFGPVVKPLVEAWTRREESVETNANHPSIPGYQGDAHPIDANIGMEAQSDIFGTQYPGAGRPLAVPHGFLP